MKKLMTVCFLITASLTSVVMSGCSSAPKATEEPAVADVSQTATTETQSPVNLGAASAGRGR
jgi:hypothetical protein